MIGPGDVHLQADALDPVWPSQQSWGVRRRQPLTNSSMRTRSGGLLGGLFGALLAACWLVPQVRADLAGEPVLGFMEAAFFTSLPLSPLSLPLLALAPDPLPRPVVYAWMALTPVLNWALLGALFVYWRARRQARSAVSGRRLT